MDILDSIEYDQLRRGLNGGDPLYYDEAAHKENTRWRFNNMAQSIRAKQAEDAHIAASKQSPDLAKKLHEQNLKKYAERAAAMAQQTAAREAEVARLKAVADAQARANQGKGFGGVIKGLSGLAVIPQLLNMRNTIADAQQQGIDPMIKFLGNMLPYETVIRNEQGQLVHTKSGEPFDEVY